MQSVVLKSILRSYLYPLGHPESEGFYVATVYTVCIVLSNLICIYKTMKSLPISKTDKPCPYSIITVTQFFLRQLVAFAGISANGDIT